MAVKIAITYEKGGVGKTTTAVNLSAIFAELGYKVLLVDLDLQSYATSYFDMYDDKLPCIFEVMCDDNDITAEAAIRHIDLESIDTLDLLPSNYRFRKMDTVLMMKTKRQEYTLKKCLSPIENNYDFIIFDCPPNGERVKENALAYADFLILPTIPDDNALHGLRCLSTEVVDVKEDVNPHLSVLGVLVTIDENTRNKRAYRQVLQEQTIFPAFKTVIRKNTYLSEARNAHLPINLYDKSSHGYADYNSLAHEILEILTPKGEN